MHVTGVDVQNISNRTRFYFFNAIYNSEQAIKIDILNHISQRRRKINEMYSSMK